MITRGRVQKGGDPEMEIPTREVLHSSAVTSRTRGYVISRARLAAEAEASKILRDAEGAAAELKRAAELEASARFDAAEREGHRAGALELAALISEWQRKTAADDQSSLGRAITMATLLAERIIGESLPLEPSRIHTIARELAEQAKGARTLKFRVHPEDEHELRAAFTEDPNVNVELDPTLSRGSVLLQTDLGVVDGRLEIRLARLAQEIRRARGA